MQQILKSSILPSDILGIEDEYTAFCFNEACAFIVSKINDGQEPIIKDIGKEEKVYSRPSDFYNKFN